MVKISQKTDESLFHIVNSIASWLREILSFFGAPFKTQGHTYIIYIYIFVFISVCQSHQDTIVKISQRSDQYLFYILN